MEYGGLFHAICHNMRRVGLIDPGVKHMRKGVAAYMRYNPSIDGNEGSHYKHFLAGTEAAGDNEIRFDEDGPFTNTGGLCY